MNESLMPRLRQVVFDSRDARRSAEFCRQLLGLVYRPGHEPPTTGEPDAVGQDWLNLDNLDGTPCLAFQQVDQLPRTTWPEDGVSQQLHLDLTVRTSSELDDVHARIIERGGLVRFDRSDDAQEPLRVYVDPDGHTFCVIVVAD